MTDRKCETCRHWGDEDHGIIDQYPDDGRERRYVKTALRDCERFEQMPPRTFAAWVQRVEGWATPEFIARDKRIVETDVADAVAGRAPRLSSDCCTGYIATPPDHFCACWEAER